MNFIKKIKEIFTTFFILVIPFGIIVYIFGGNNGGYIKKPNKKIEEERTEPLQGWNATQAVEKYLKSNLKDPKSLEYITVYKVQELTNNQTKSYKEKEFMQGIKYRAKNSFGGYVIEEKIFIIKNDEVISVL